MTQNEPQFYLSVMRAIHDGIVYVNKYLPPTNNWLTLMTSVPVALACGTLFAYSVYSTQLAERCQLSASQSANLNISIVVGSAIGGLIGGLVTDIYGTQLPMLISSVSVFVGYKWLYELYLGGVDTTMAALVATMFLIGIGSTAGYFSAIKAVAIEFPNYKGTAQSITIASFAISASIYSLIASHIFDGNIENFLYFLHIDCGIMIFIGFIFIRVEGHYKYPDIEAQDNLDEALSLVPSHSVDVNSKVNLKSLDLKESLQHPIFWFHFAVFSIIQGLGQMYIFEVGYIVKALYNYYKDSADYEIAPLNHYLALHVSLIAIFSFIGRLSSGPLSDYVVNSLHAQRHWNLIIGLSIMLIGHFLNTLQYVGSTLSSSNLFLLVVSSIIGYAYGFSFTCYPVIISDIFNMENYSFIWGLMYSSTVFGLTLMSKLFGHYYDINSHYTKDNEYICSVGANCYNKTFSITCGLCVVVIVAILGYIRLKR